MMGNNVCDCPDCLMGNNDALKYPDNNFTGSTDDVADDARGRNSEAAPTSAARALAAVAAAVGTAIRSLTLKQKIVEAPSVQSIELTPVVTESCDCKAKPGALAALAQRFGPLMGLRTAKGRGGLSDVDTRAALQATMSGSDVRGYIIATYDDFFVYEDYMSGDVYQQSYSISPSGQVSLKDDAVQVRPVTSFVPVNNSTEGVVIMATKAKVDGLIANSSGQFVEADRTWLTAMSDEQLDKFVKMGIDAAKAERSNAEAATKEATAAAVAEALKANAEKTPKTLEEFIASAPAEVGMVLSEGIALQRNRKDFLLNALKTNTRNKFSEEELKGMSLGMLENLATLASGPDYTGAGGSARVAAVQARENEANPMPEAFPKKNLGDKTAA
jgi:hypothetical protein